MKRIVILLVTLSLVTIAVFQYIRYNRFKVSDKYDYHIPPGIDPNYYDQKTVLEYYDLAYQIGSYARNMWFNEGIDVKLAEKNNALSQNATAKYNQMLATESFLEAKLKESARLKSFGYDNAAIKNIEQTGISVNQHDIQLFLGGKTFQEGDKGQEVLEIQKILHSVGYNLRIDGIFSVETQGYVKEFQQSKQIYPSGIADPITINALIRAYKQ
jgi:hypothetical protein